MFNKVFEPYRSILLTLFLQNYNHFIALYSHLVWNSSMEYGFIEFLKMSKVEVYIYFASLNFV